MDDTKLRKIVTSLLNPAMAESRHSNMHKKIHEQAFLYLLLLCLFLTSRWK